MDAKAALQEHERGTLVASLRGARLTSGSSVQCSVAQVGLLIECTPADRDTCGHVRAHHIASHNHLGRHTPDAACVQRLLKRRKDQVPDSLGEAIKPEEQSYLDAKESVAQKIFSNQESEQGVRCAFATHSINRMPAIVIHSA